MCPQIKKTVYVNEIFTLDLSPVYDIKLEKKAFGNIKVTWKDKNNDNKFSKTPRYKIQIKKDEASNWKFLKINGTKEANLQKFYIIKVSAGCQILLHI